MPLSVLLLTKGSEIFVEDGRHYHFCISSPGCLLALVPGPRAAFPRKTHAPRQGLWATSASFSIPARSKHPSTLGSGLWGHKASWPRHASVWLASKSTGSRFFSFLQIPSLPQTGLPALPPSYSPPRGIFPCSLAVLVIRELFLWWFVSSH